MTVRGEGRRDKEEGEEGEEEGEEEEEELVMAISFSILQKGQTNHPQLCMVVSSFYHEVGLIHIYQENPLS